MHTPAYQTWLETATETYEAESVTGIADRAGRWRGIADGICLQWALLREMRGLRDAVERALERLPEKRK